MKKRLTLPEICSDIYNVWNYDKNDFGPEFYTIGLNTKVYLKCNRGHENYVRVNRIKFNTTYICPYCIGTKLCPENSFGALYPNLLKEWDYDKNRLGPDQYTQTSNKVVWWKCNNGHSFEQRIKQRIYGCRCPYCSNRKACNDNCLSTKYPEIAKEWDYQKNKGSPQDYVYGSSIIKYWKCQKGHSFKQSIVNRTRYNQGCPYCINQKVSKDNCLAATHPYLLDSWDFDKNNISPYEVTYGSQKKVWWKCEKHGSYNSSISGRAIKNYECPYCSNRKVCENNCLATTHPEIAKQLLVEKSGFGPKDVVGKSNKTAYWRCEKGHEWKTTIAARASGSGCHYCSGYKMLEKDSFYNRSREIYERYWDKENNTIDPKKVSYGSNKRVNCKCEKGHKWKLSLKRLSNKEGCPYCSGRRLCDDNNLLFCNPKLCREWHPIKNKLGPKNYLHHSGKRVWWKCEKEHEWKAVIASRVRGNGCPYCANKKVCLDNCLATKNPELSKQMIVEKTGFGPYDVVEKSKKMAWWKCEKGHEWKATINDRSYGSGCPVCTKTGFSVVSNKWLDKLKIKDREIKIGKYKVDGFKDNIVYEYLGHFWHGDPRHHYPDDKNNIIKKSFILLLYNTILRLNKIHKLGYKIMYCWEHEEIIREYCPIYITKEELKKQAMEIYNNKKSKDILANE